VDDFFELMPTISVKKGTAERLRALRCTLFIASQEISATFKQHICDMQFNVVAVALKS
jgi:hypothetical protein